MNIKGFARASWHMLRDTVSSWLDDYAPSMGAALAFYTLFSLAPLLLIVISVAGLVVGQDVAREQLLEQLSGMVGDDASRTIQTVLESLNRPEAGVIGTVVGVVVLIIGSTTVFAELQGALDRIWRAPSRPARSGLWRLLRARLLSLGLVLGIGFLLLVSLVVSTGLSVLGKWWAPLFGDKAYIASLLDIFVSLCFITVMFAVIYKWMPRVSVAWRDVFVGAVLTAVLFTVGKTLIGLYIGRSGVASPFGAAASLVVLLLWVYYSAQIFLLGAEFTWVYARRYGSLKGRENIPASPSAAQTAAESAGENKSNTPVITPHDSAGGGSDSQNAPHRP